MLVVSLIYGNHSLYSFPIPAPLMVSLCVFSGDIHMSLCRKTGRTVDVDVFWTSTYWVCSENSVQLNFSGYLEKYA